MLFRSSVHFKKWLPDMQKFVISCIFDVEIKLAAPWKAEKVSRSMHLFILYLTICMLLDSQGQRSLINVTTDKLP